MTVTRKGRPNPNQGGMTALLSSNAAHARSYDPGEDVLREWYEVQVKALTTHVERLKVALEKAYEGLPPVPGEGVE